MQSSCLCPSLQKRKQLSGWICNARRLRYSPYRHHAFLQVLFLRTLQRLLQMPEVPRSQQPCCRSQGILQRTISFCQQKCSPEGPRQPLRQPSPVLLRRFLSADQLPFYGQPQRPCRSACQDRSALKQKFPQPDSSLTWTGVQRQFSCLSSPEGRSCSVR